MVVTLSSEVNLDFHKEFKPFFVFKYLFNGVNKWPIKHKLPGLVKLKQLQHTTTKTNSFFCSWRFLSNLKFPFKPHKLFLNLPMTDINLTKVLSSFSLSGVAAGHYTTFPDTANWLSMTFRWPLVRERSQQSSTRIVHHCCTTHYVYSDALYKDRSIIDQWTNCSDLPVLGIKPWILKC